MKKGDKSIVLIGLIVLILVITVVLLFYFFRNDALTNALNRGLPVNLLFTVTDGDDLEFVELFIYSPETKKAGIYFVPANMGGRLSSPDRVDAISVLYKKGDPASLIKQLEQVTGLHLDYYIDIQMENLRRLVDLVEGVELFISNPVDLKYEERTILIPSGSVVLDGDKLVDYVSFREEAEESRESIWRKQKFLQGLLKRFGTDRIRDELLIDEVFESFYGTLSTNISARDLKAFLQEMSTFDAEQIVFQRVEGKSQLVDTKMLLFPYFEGELVKHTVKQLIESVKSDVVFTEDALNVTLEILNGTDRNGLAGNTASLYEQLGYDVISIANADNDQYVNTLILDRKGRSEIVQQVADIIKCKRIHTELNADVESRLDVTIIIGQDFDGRYCK